MKKIRTNVNYIKDLSAEIAAYLDTYNKKMTAEEVAAFRLRVDEMMTELAKAFERLQKNKSFSDN